MSAEFEEWRDAPGSDGWYDVSSLGRVRSWWGIVGGGHRGQRGRRREPRVLKAPRNQDGYRRFSMHVDGAPFDTLVHRLVCEAFNGTAPFEGAVVRHLDGDVLNNLPLNLAWGTVQDNHDDMARHGTRLVGSANSRARLTDSAVREMRELYATGLHTYKAIGLRFGVSHTAATAAIERRSWQHVA